MEGKAVRVIRLQQHMRKGSIQDSSTHHSSLELQGAFHTALCGPPTFCRFTQRLQDNHVPSQDLFGTSLQHMHAVSKGQSSKTCSSSGYNPSSISQPKWRAHAQSCANIVF